MTGDGRLVGALSDKPPFSFFLGENGDCIGQEFFHCYNSNISILVFQCVKMWRRLVREKRRYWYTFAIILFFLVASVAASTWVWSRYQASQTGQSQHGSSTVTASGKGTATTPGIPPATTSATSQASLEMHQGAKLIIPAIGVSAPVEAVGRDAQGHMQVPQANPWEGVGWYQLGVAPGQSGSAVIDGHLDRPGGTAAVFWNLHKLHAGDEVRVEDSKGHTLRFRVYKIESYEPTDAPLKQIFNDTSGTYLNLITCAGQWNPAQHQTTQRLVVYTRLEQ